MIYEILSLFSIAFESCWSWFSDLIYSIDCYNFLISIISICIISRFIILPFFRSTFNTRSDYRRVQKKQRGSDDDN